MTILERLTLQLEAVVPLVRDLQEILREEGDRKRGLER